MAIKNSLVSIVSLYSLVSIVYMNAIASIKDYFKGSLSEMKKVVWPSKKQTTTYSLIVIAMSIGVAIFFGFLDYIFNIGLEMFIR